MSPLSRGVASAIRRYHPYAVVVAAVTSIVLVPAAGMDHRASPLGTEHGLQAPPHGAAGDDAGAAEADRSRSALRASVGEARASASGAAATVEEKRQNNAALTAAVRYPGTRSAEALAHARCDPSTGNVRIPSLFAAECVVPWPAGADNGGATSPGVTSDVIRIVFYGGDQDEGYNRIWLEYAELYNTHYELWGRHVELIFFKPTGTDEVAQRADAIKVATDLKPFMSLYMADTPRHVYAAEVASRGVIVYDGNVLWRDTQEQAPYRWGIRPDDRLQILHITEYVGKRLNGRVARWSGDAALRTRPRSFGLVHAASLDNAFFDEQARARGIRIAASLSYKDGDTGRYQEQARTTIARLKRDGVTSVIAATEPVYTAILTREATNQLFSPEWIVTGYNRQDVILYGRLYDQRQWANAFGIGATPPITPVKLSEWVTLYEWHFGRSPGDNALSYAAAGQAWFTFRQVFAGLQLAGPPLTPGSFRDAMFSLEPRGGSYCDCRVTLGQSWGRQLGLPWDDYTAYDDLNESWWDPTRRGSDEINVFGPGMYMRVDGGRRYLPGHWPDTEPRVFEAEGAVDAYPDYPPAEAPPRYDRPSG